MCIKHVIDTVLNSQRQLNSFWRWIGSHWSDVNITCGIMQNNPSVLFLSVVMFPHQLKIQAFLIIYCHWGRCFAWFLSVCSRWLWNTHQCIGVCMLDRLPSSLSSEEQTAMMIHSQKASFNYSQIRSRGHPGGAAALQWQWAIRSELHITNHSEIPTALDSREEDFNLQRSHQWDFCPPGVSERV